MYTATYLKLAEAPDPRAARRLALQLARHYTDDYLIAEKPHNVKLVADFENVLHAFALEGCATIVDPTPPAGLAASEFLVNLKTTS